MAKSNSNPVTNAPEFYISMTDPRAKKRGLGNVAAVFTSGDYKFRMHTPEELRETWEKFCVKRVAKFVTQKSVSFAQFSLFIWNPEDESSPL